MSLFSKWIDLIQQIFVPRAVHNTVEAVAVEVAAVEAKTVIATVEPAAKKAPAKAKAPKAKAADKAPVKKPKKPNIKIAK